jgi:hypothetical protein|tara:strand:- start:29 stop:748 length:720 start_codon:yes stop_codon:yes gene_type:complete
MGIFGSLDNLGKAAQSLGRDMFGLEIKSNSKIANIAKESGVTLDTLETAPLETLSDILNTAARQRLLDPRFANSINIQIAKDAQAAMPAMPTLKIDNPGGDWLESKLRYAQAARDDAEPNTYRSTLGTGEGVTGYFTERLRLDPTTLANVAGSVGEERYRPDANKMRRLRQSIAETGYEESPILIHVREDGVPFVVEGNHRIIEGIESGRPTIPVEINYLRGAEDVDGPLSPESLGVPR